MDNVKLDLTTSAIPEPSTYAAGMGVVVALAAFVIRRKRRA